MSNKPALIICYGVSGCGKSTAAHYISEQLGFQYIEADDFHPEVNKAHMAAGKPLTDEMREPWIQTLCSHIKSEMDAGKSCVMANSCLKKIYRQRYRDIGFPTLFIHLEGSYELIYERMQARENHFMPASLLQSQFDTLESAEGEANVVSLDISAPLEDLKDMTIDEVKNFLAL